MGKNTERSGTLNSYSSIFQYALDEAVAKPRIFVSYYHDEDQAWADRLSTLFHDTFNVVTDRSLESPVDSDANDYIRRFIREQNITGTSVTVVLCGPNTWKRKWVDWEIQMTLNKEHGLLGVVLPKQRPTIFQPNYLVPDRLFANVQSSYAHWIHWTEDPLVFLTAVNEAKRRSEWTALIRNGEPAMSRNLP